MFFLYYYYYYYCRGYQQQDAHEFMRYLLDKLHTELVQVQEMGWQIRASPLSNASTAATTSIVSDIFGGLLQSDVSRLHTVDLFRGSTDRSILALMTR